jgi:hypothetical protein
MGNFPAGRQRQEPLDSSDANPFAMDHSANALDPAEVVVREEALDPVSLRAQEAGGLVEAQRARVHAQDLGRHADGIGGQIIRDEEGWFRSRLATLEFHINNVGRGAVVVKDMAGSVCRSLDNKFE